VIDKQGKRRFKNSKFVIDDYAKGLKDSRKRFGFVRRVYDRANDIGEIAGGCNGCLSPLFDDCLRDATGLALFAKLKKDVGKLTLAGSSKNIGSGRCIGILIEAQIEGGIGPVGKSA
jgi:hypothetical protein